jgi:hypothetical protein
VLALLTIAVAAAIASVTIAYNSGYAGVKEKECVAQRRGLVARLGESSPLA